MAIYFCEGKKYNITIDAFFRKKYDYQSRSSIAPIIYLLVEQNDASRGTSKPEMHSNRASHILTAQK